MANITAKGVTNDRPGSYVEVTINCDVVWSAAHAFSYVRLSEEGKDDLHFNLLDCYYTRARRIAGTYARFYLEQEQGCEPDKKGRFYWMALGAFASKTVACLLDTFQVKGSFAWGLLTLSDMKVISEGLGLGNMWLFMDVATWHWAYANYNDHYFKGMMCESKRDAQKLLDNSDGSGGVKTTVTKNLEWASYALPRINDLKSTPYIREGMKLVEEIEKMDINDENRQKKQFDHLSEVADHEQLEILQKLIYNHPVFVKWIKRQRENWFLNLISPEYELAFSANCDIEDETLKSVSPEGMKLEEAGSLEDARQKTPTTRLGWIGQAAAQFHRHMQEKQNYMEGELQKMTGWIDEPDFSESCISVAKVSGAFK